MRSPPDHNPLLDAVLSAVDVPAGGRLLVAVSGGADSMALLHAALEVAHSGLREWEIGVAHVNHCLRGAHSDDDERFVRSIVEQVRLPLWSTRVGTRAHAAAHRLSIEAAARELRYRALLDMLAEWNADALLTGHTQDDQAETVLLRLLRGSGLRGLGGMRRQTGYIVRPFLGIRHEEILTFLQSRGLGYRVDASNADPHHTRNLLRRDILPALDLLQPRLVPVLARTAEVFQHDADFVFGQAGEALHLMDVDERGRSLVASRDVWRSLHPSLRRATLIILLDRLEGGLAELTHQHLASLETALELGLSAARDPLPRGITVDLTGGRFELSTVPQPAAEPIAETKLRIPGETRLKSGAVRGIESGRPAELERMLTVVGPLHLLCDADAITSPLLLTHRLPGDRLTPLGAPGSRKLHDLMIDRKVPRQERDRVPVIRDSDGIVWVVGLAVAARVAVTPDTQRVLHLRWEPEPRNSVVESLAHFFRG